MSGRIPQTFIDDLLARTDIIDVINTYVPLRKAGITSELTRLTDDIARKEDRVAEYEARLRRQYAALDALLGQLQSQMGYLQASTSAKN